MTEDRGKAESETVPKPQELAVIEPIIPGILEIVRHDLGEAKTKEVKEDETTLTQTDLRLERLITETIKKAFPQDTILAEELSPDETRSAKRLWAIDPLCGSFNFSAGIPVAATNFTLFERAYPKFALVVDHLNQTYYWASKDIEGVFQKDTSVERISLPEAKRMINLDFGNIMNKLLPDREQRIIAFANITHNLVRERFELVNFYSSLSATYAALGRRAAFIIPGTNPWDIAPACFLTEKQGGVATDFSGKRAHPQMTSAIGSLDKNLHQQLLVIIQDHWPSG